MVHQDFITVAHGTACWGTGATQPNSTCNVAGVDAVLHRAPKGFYPGVQERGLLVVWNGVNATQAAVTLSLPLYYAGLAPGAVVAVRQEEGTSARAQLDGNATLALPPFEMAPLTVTYFVVEEA